MASPESTSGLLTPVQFLPGVGPRRASVLAKLGLVTARDVLFFFPRDYQDLSALVSIADFEEGALTRFVGEVADVELRELGGRRSMLGVVIAQGHHHVRAVWFNQPFLARKLQAGDRVVVTGTPKLRAARYELHHPELRVLAEEESAEVGLQPVYRLTEGISQYQMRSVTRAVVAQLSGEVEEVFPDPLRDQYGLADIGWAIEQVHRPDSAESLAKARYRLAYQELFTMQLALALRHASVTQATSPALTCDGKVDARIARLLPFELTAGQRAVIDEIVQDLRQPRAMNRMLQGDVGSGKTLVAVYAMLVAIANGCQAVLMAPTEILAQQHYDTMDALLAGSRVRMALVSGSATPAQRKKIMEKIAAGDVDLVIGTQALVQKGMQFSKLALAVVDEGHKFGVEQRARLRRAEQEPHYLVMTATPIPRSVSMTLFGDLDVSTLREMPGGRKPTYTYVGLEDRRANWWEFVRKKLREGRQAYVIAPLVEGAEGAAVTSAEQLYEHLCSEELDAFRVGLVHGRMSGDEKQDALARFRQGDLQVLVATSLVEVGVDIPNACVMTIENAERFGLAQLHQLRGRVGRGEHPGFVCAFSPSDAEDARLRLDAFASTADGFELAERDFALRGPGDLFGKNQHGLPKLRVADLQSDLDILERARADARALALADATLSAPELAALRERVFLRYGKSLELGDVG